MHNTSLPAGTVIGGRFRIERPAGQGGMGAVFRAHDMLSGQAVALKLMHPSDQPEALRRFTREAELLSKLGHPGIVAYVAHGIVEGNKPFLAMEWLEGESVLDRLARQPLLVAETLLLLRRIAEALDAAHQRGIVHRDIKPANLFLRSGRIEDVVLLDFGLARHAVSSLALTPHAAVLGTPGYMAPEQVSCEKDVAPGADIFSLGCLLYECLTGRQPFMAPSVPAVLAKILFTEPPPLSSLRKDLSASWQPLVHDMLAKDPARRLRDARSLLSALSELEPGSSSGAPPSRGERGPSSGASGAEQQLVSVLLAAPAVLEADVPTLTLEPGQNAFQERAFLGSLREELAAQGARAELLVDGSLLASFLPERGTATDCAALAARGALLLKERWPEARVVLTTGRGFLGGQRVVGEAMDRAGSLLRWLGEKPAPHPALDELTAGLLGPGFLLASVQKDLFLLKGERLSVDETRPLLGKPTPCVGRERELAMLEFTLDACIEESSARAVLVTAPAGMGKSRLRYELLRRLERREVLVLMGRGEPLSAKAACGLLGQALLRLCGIHQAEPRQARLEKFTQRISRNLAPEQARDAVAFLSELCGLSAAADGNHRLRAAREDPALMSVQVNRALASFLRAECARGPVLLVLEDLHWSDALTLKLVDEALRELSDSPLMVLALGRPEVKSSFPGLWSRALMELPLSALSKKAATQLVREVLGESLSPEAAGRLVEHAAGNALFLEELIRSMKEGRGESPPKTVLAMLQARILRLSPEERQVLLAASLFGRTFWSGGVKALLEQSPATQGLELRLQQLVELEMIEPQPDSRFPAEREFRFRHALLRDAAQELVPDSHKPASHRRAGAWLEQVGEPDPLVLAEHFQLGQEQERASHFYAQAAEQCLGLALPRLLHSLEAAMASGCSSPVRAKLRVLQTTAYVWMGDNARAIEAGREALPELRPGSVLWCRLIYHLIYSSLIGNAPAYAMELSLLLLAQDPDEDAVESYVDTVCVLAGLNISRGARPEAMMLMTRAQHVCGERLEHNAFLRGVLRWAQSLFTHVLEARPWHARMLAHQAVQAFRGLELEWKLTTALVVEGFCLLALGDRTGALEKMHESQALTRALGRPMHLHYADIHALIALSDSSVEAHRQEARALAFKWVGVPSPNPFLSCVVHLALCRVTAEPHEAEAHGRKACELKGAVLHQHAAYSALSGLLLAQGRASEARHFATMGVREWAKTEGAGMGAVGAYVALAEACFAQGDAEAGEAALTQALRDLEARAADIPDAPARERFLHQVPENARALELARQRKQATRA